MLLVCCGNVVASRHIRKGHNLTEDYYPACSPSRRASTPRHTWTRERLAPHHTTLYLDDNAKSEEMAAPVVVNLSSQATVGEVEVCDSSASSGVEDIEARARQGTSVHAEQVEQDMEQDAQRRDSDEHMEEEPRQDSMGEATLQMAGAGQQTQYFDIMAHDVASEMEGDERESRKEHTDAPPFVKARSVAPSDLWLGAEEMEREAAAAAPPSRASPAQPAPWPAPPKTPPTRGASAAAATPTRSSRTQKGAADVDKIDKMMEMMMRNHELVQTRFDGIQEKIELQVLETKKRFEAVDEHFQTVEKKMDYAHEQARERFRAHWGQICQARARRRRGRSRAARRRRRTASRSSVRELRGRGVGRGGHQQGPALVGEQGFVDGRDGDLRAEPAADGPLPSLGGSDGGYENSNASSPGAHRG